MSLDPDALAEMARNRGLKLIRSRIRKAGKPGFGMFGLSDAAGKPVFGIEGKTLAADAQQVADYLRGAEAGDWKSSLKAVGAAAPRKRKAARKTAPELAPEPVEIIELREATRDDAPQLAALFATLDHMIEPAAVARNLQALDKDDLRTLVVTSGKQVIAVCGLARTLTPHRPFPVGRITVLVVAKEWQRQGHGKRLVEEAERRLAAAGCMLLEVTSNDRLTGAHAFYRRLGYERTSMRFAKLLALG